MSEPKQKRWILAFGQALMLMVFIFGVCVLLDMIAPTTQQTTAIGWRWLMVGGVTCWGVLGAIFHLLEEEL